MAKLQNKVTPIIDQGGGTGGVIERQESNDSLDKEMQEIDQSVPRILSNNPSVEQSMISQIDNSKSIAEVSINASAADIEIEPEIPIEQSRISKTLTEQTMQAIVLIILSLLFLLPLFMPDTYDGSNRVNAEQLSIVAELYASDSWEAYINAVVMMIRKTNNDKIYPIIFLEVASIVGKPFN